MTDNPYNLDPSRTITDCHWGDLFALFCVSLDLGYFGQSTGPFRIYIDEANFPVFGDGTIWNYPSYSAVDAPSTAQPDNIAMAALVPLPDPQTNPPIIRPLIPDTLSGDLTSYFENYYSWCLKPWVTPGLFGFGGTNVFGLNLSKIYELLGGTDVLNSGYKPTIRFTIKTDGIPDRTDIGAFTYTFLTMGFGGIVATNLGGTGVPRSTNSPLLSPGFVPGQIAPVNFSNPTDDPTNYLLAAEGFYTVGINPSFSFFGHDDQFFYFDAGVGVGGDIVPYIKSSASVLIPQVALHNTYTMTGNYFSDEGFAPIINVTIGPPGINVGDPNNRIDLSGSYGSNENNFQLFAF